MAEALFYHLTAQPLERALPDLLERTLSRGWRAVVRCGSPERMEALDTHLWTYKDESFLPHAATGCAAPERQPIYLTTGDEIPNEADALFLVDAADTQDFTGFERVVIMFTGDDEAALTLARTQWKRAVESVKATYWQQQDGRWIKKRESEAPTT